MPAGDLFYQFRSDVENGKLPTVSWLASPQNFSDHPSAPWYGAWYVSEVMDILTKNPEVWKKTIFIVTYDENDGYYDHVPRSPSPTATNPARARYPPVSIRKLNMYGWPMNWRRALLRSMPVRPR